jgi:methionyl-tRNA formyltransferase
MIPPAPWRVVIFTSIAPAAVGLDALARAAGHEPVAVLVPRPKEGAPEQRTHAFHALLATAPPHLDVVAVPSKARLAPLVRAYEPDLGMCAAYPWLLPPEVLGVPRLGIVNNHPSLLPRYRGPSPLAWAVRNRDQELGMTVHLMDDRFDTGPILAQGSKPMPDEPSWETLPAVLAELTQELVPRALERLAAGERGDPQAPDEGDWAGRFPDEELDLDLSLPAEHALARVRSWQFMSAPGERGPRIELDGELVRIVRASLTDPGDGARRVECADAPLWIVETEPV